MKKLFSLLLLLALAPLAVAQKVTDLPAASAITADDLTLLVNSPSSGAQTQKATAQQIADFVLGSNSTLSDFLALTPTNDDVLQRKAGEWINRSLAQLRTDLGLVIGTNVQAWDGDLDTWAGKTAPAGTVVGTTDTQTLTNKSISGGQITSAVANATSAVTATSAGTAAALSANGTNCDVGDAARGTDASGNAEGCFTPATGAPTNATYITQTANATLSDEQALGNLATGLLKSTTTTGVLSIATAGSDYYAPGGTSVPVADGGTGASTPAGARSNLDAQQHDTDLDDWAAKTAPAGTAVGTSDTQTLTNKSISGGQITSAVATATALAANGTNCSAGQYARGVDASGNAENCTADSVGGDASTNTATSVDGEVALFSGTGGKTIKRATGSGLVKLTSGVQSIATAGTDYQAAIASSTWAARGTGSAVGELKRITDVGPAPGILVWWDGTYWKATAPITPLLDLGTSQGSLGTSLQILKTLTVPAGLLRLGRQYSIKLVAGRSAATDAATIGLRVGAAGAVGDAVVYSNGLISSANRSYGTDTLLEMVSATSLRSAAVTGNNPGFTNTATTAVYPNVTLAIADLDTTVLFITASVTMSGSTDAGQIHRLSLEIIP